MMSVQTCTPMAKTQSCQMKDGQALNQMKECQAPRQRKVACQLRQCDDNEFHVTFELRTDGVYITNIPYNNITPRIVTPAKLLQINHENVECDMTRFREMIATLKQNKLNDLVVDGEIKSCLKRKQHSGRRTSKRKRLESHHVNFDLTKNQTKIVDRYIMSEERAKHILRQVLKERMRAAIRIQRAVRRYFSVRRSTQYCPRNCFVNVLPFSLYPVRKVVDTTKVHKYGAEPNGDVLRQKVGDPYAILPLEDGDRIMFIDDQGKRKKRPINEYATKLAGFPIYGDVAVAANKKRKLNVKMERKTM